MKIDANSGEAPRRDIILMLDGTMDWNEFSTYMTSASIGKTEVSIVIEEKKRKATATPHKDMIIFIDYVIKERKYITVR